MAIWYCDRPGCIFGTPSASYRARHEHMHRHSADARIRAGFTALSRLALWAWLETTYAQDFLTRADALTSALLRGQLILTYPGATQ